MDKITRARVRNWRANPSEENAQAVAAAVSRSADASQETRKVIISPGYGSGFAPHFEYYAPGLGRFVAEYAPLIDAIESGEGFAAALRSLIKDIRNFPGMGVTLPGEDPTDRLQAYPPVLRDLKVMEVTGPYRITEYDGSETVETLDRVLHRYW